MKTRVITGLILVLVFVPVFVIGEIPLSIALLLLSMGATFELFKMFNKGREINKVVLGIEMLLSGGLYYLIQSYYLGDIVLDWVFVAIMFIVFIGALLLVFIDKFTASDYSGMFLAILYPTIGFGAIFGLRSMDLHNLGFLFTITIMTDVFAYLVGVKFGKHRLAVKISPKKSIEGSIGGTFFATVLTIVYIYVFELTHVGEIELNIFISIILIIFISCIGQIGDLVASKLKRHFEIKDYSNLFPGHGGIMDRFDSALFAGMALMLISKVVGIL